MTTKEDGGGFDPVAKPRHYNSHPSGVEVIELTEGLDFCTGNAVKYICRHELKGSPVEDLKKAMWYLERASILADEGALPAAGRKAVGRIARYIENEPSTGVREALGLILFGKSTSRNWGGMYRACALIEAVAVVRDMISKLEAVHAGAAESKS